LKGQKVTPGKQRSTEVVTWKVMHGKDRGRKAERQRVEIGKVDVEAGDCENERSRWADRKGGG
jgi:hypothetical protein